MRARSPLLLAACSLLCLMFGAEGRDARVASADPTPNAYALVQDVATASFTRMVDFAVLPGTDERQAIVVTQKDARVRRVSLTGAFAPVEFGNLSGLVETGGNEEGLLSLAISPDYLSDGRVYAYYTSLSCLPGVTRCARIMRFPVVSNDMNEAMGTLVLEIDQVQTNQSNHNGGRLLFGPDGYLYLSIGDGGGAGDPLETGQIKDDLLASVLRIHVTGQATYAIPPGNPYIGVAGADEVWAHGLRNPWRFSFDRTTGALWLADVGQMNWEEVEPIVAGGNYGWDCYEGNVPYESTDCAASGFTFPREVYPHSLGCSVSGGYVYRGSALPDLYGWYVFGDYCTGRIWAVNTATPAGAEIQLLDSDFSIASFAERPDGELLVMTFENAIYRLTCAGPADGDSDGVGDACDNCPATANSGQYDADGDDTGDACEVDDDNDGVFDDAEVACGGDPLDATPPLSRPERLDGPFDNADDDGDTAVDEALPPGSEAFDCDGDGWTGAQEQLIFAAGTTANDQDACGNNGWAADLLSSNQLNIGDVNSFLQPARGSDDGHATFNKMFHTLDDTAPFDGASAIEAAMARWNLALPPHTGTTAINIGDLNALIAGGAGSPARPPMFGGQPAFFTNGGVCPWPP